MAFTVPRVALVGLLLVGGTGPAAAAQAELRPVDQLFDAARAGDRTRVEALLAAGVDLDTQDRYGSTALFFAADRGHLALVQFLVERGASINFEDTFYRTTPLGRALNRGHLDVATFLLERGAEPAGPALLVAVREQHASLFAAAIASGGLYAEDVAAALEAARELSATRFAERLARVTAPPQPVPTIDAGALDAYVGAYQNDALDRVVEVGVENEHLTVRLGNGAALALRPRGEARFGADTADVELTFGGRGGMVEYLVLTRGTTSTQFRPFDEAESREAAPAGRGDVISADALPAVERSAPRPWPSFRGPNASGIADGQGVPTMWDVATGENIRWKTPVPGFATSAPIIWGNRVFLTSAVSSAADRTFRTGQYGDTTPVDDLSPHRWLLYALDTDTGEVVWERLVHEGVPGTKRHQKSSQANSTPATDGRRVVALFGSVGLLVCYDVDGTLLWKKELGVLDSGWFYDAGHQWGHASSPIITSGRVIVQADTRAAPYVAAFDLDTGDEVWRTAREEEISTFATPAVYHGPDGDELVTNGTQIRGYDLETGELLWFLGPNSEIPIAAPVFTDDLIFVTAGYPPVRPIYAIRPGQRGDLALPEGRDRSRAVAWSKNRGGTYIPTPIAYRGYLYLNANNGRLTCYDAKTGKQVYRARIGGVGGSYAASPIAADGRLYFSSEDGIVYVVKAGPQYELLARNELDEIVMSNPAASDGLLVIRTLGHVYGISEEP